MQTKITMRYHYTRLSKILNFIISSVGMVVKQLELPYTAIQSVNQEQDVWKIKIEGYFQIARIEMAFLKTFRWDWRIRDWSDQAIPSKKDTLYKGLNLVKGLASLRNWKCGWGQKDQEAQGQNCIQWYPVSSSILAMVRIFTPWKLANATIQSVCFFHL